MRNVLKKRECTEYVFQVVMEKKDLTVIDQVLQKDYKNLQGRSSILDCVARDSEGRQMNVEIQQENEGASPKRARYHSGLMDMNTLNPGQDFDELPESYMIFIPDNKRSMILWMKRISSVNAKSRMIQEGNILTLKMQRICTARFWRIGHMS